MAKNDLADKIPILEESTLRIPRNRRGSDAPELDLSAQALQLDQTLDALQLDHSAALPEKDRSEELPERVPSPQRNQLEVWNNDSFDYKGHTKNRIPRALFWTFIIATCLIVLGIALGVGLGVGLQARNPTGGQTTTYVSRSPYSYPDIYIDNCYLVPVYLYLLACHQHYRTRS